MASSKNVDSSSKLNPLHRRRKNYDASEDLKNLKVSQINSTPSDIFIHSARQTNGQTGQWCDNIARTVLQTVAVNKTGHKFARKYKENVYITRMWANAQRDGCMFSIFLPSAIVVEFRI